MKTEEHVADILKGHSVCGFCADRWLSIVGLLLGVVLVVAAPAWAQSLAQNQQETVRPAHPNTIVPNEQRTDLPRRVEAPAAGARTESPAPPPLEYTEFQQFVFSSVGHMLPMYGYNLFDNVPTTFAPVERIPVTADYVIGPGDEILIRAWGQVDFDVRTSVDRNGSIFIPKVGNVRVAGLKYQQLEDFLKTAIGRLFQNFDLNVTLGELRSIQVFVVGQARRPGSYTVSSLSTLVNTLFASGGPSPKGSMRRIQLRRNNQVVTEFDLYDLLLNGDKSKDAVLLPGDVIYVPPVGQLVALAGSVNVPAIYELKGKTTLANAVQLAGGFTTTAEGQRATVERIENRVVRKVEEFPLDESGLARPLQDGDLVNIRSISPRFENAVTLRGNVAVPGRYPWHPGMRISDLIPNRESLITREYWLNQNLTAGKTTPAGGTTTAGATIIRNDVKRNAPEINWDYALVQRLNQDDLSMRLLPFNLGKAILDHDEKSNLSLLPGDTVTIFSHADLQVPIARQSKFIRLEGEFKDAGVYQVQEGDTLRDVIERAGGLTDDAYLYGAEFTRESTRIEQQKRLDTYLNEMEREIERVSASATRNIVSPEEATTLQQRLEGQRRLLAKMRQMKASGRIVFQLLPTDNLDALPKLTLEDGDRFVVPARPSVVNVMGAVYNESTYLVHRGYRVSDYLRMAGGGTREADTGRAFVIRADGSVVSQSSRSRWWSGSFESLRPMPGDTIVVPERLEKTTVLRGLKDWSQIFTQFALGAAAINVLK